MSARPAAASSFQRSAFAPSLLAALILFIAPALLDGEWFVFVRFAVAVLALIVGYFGVQAHQWWWAPVFLAIAVLWNPIAPFAFAGPWWVGAQFAAATVFLIAGSTIRVIRPPEPKR